MDFSAKIIKIPIFAVINFNRLSARIDIDTGFGSKLGLSRSRNAMKPSEISEFAYKFI